MSNTRLTKIQQWSMMDTLNLHASKSPKLNEGTPSFYIAVLGLLHLYSPEFKVTRVPINSTFRLLTNRLFVRFIECSLVVDFLDFLSAVESLKNSLRKSWNRKLNNLQYSICCQAWMSRHSAWHQGPYAESVFPENRLYNFADLYMIKMTILQ